MISLDWKNATPANLNAWRYFVTLWGATPTITPLFFVGTLGATEFETYNAKKVYFALELVVGFANAGAGVASIAIYNMANSNMSNYQNVSMAWNATGAALNYITNDINLQNIWFSRFTAALNCVKFNGYKVTWP